MSKFITGTKKVLWGAYAAVIWVLIIVGLVAWWQRGSMEKMVDNAIIYSISDEVSIGEGLKSVYNGEWKFDENRVSAMQKAGGSRAIWKGAIGMIDNGVASTEDLAVTFQITYDDLLEETYMSLERIQFGTYEWDSTMASETGINIMRVLMGIDGYVDLYNGIDENWNVQTVRLSSPSNLKNVLEEQHEVAQAGGSDSTFFGGEDNISENQSGSVTVYDHYAKYFDDGAFTYLVFHDQGNENYTIQFDNYTRNGNYLSTIDGSTTAVYDSQWELEYSNGPVSATFTINAIGDGAIEVIMTNGIEDLQYLSGTYYAE